MASASIALTALSPDLHFKKIGRCDQLIRTVAVAIFSHGDLIIAGCPQQLADMRIVIDDQYSQIFEAICHARTSLALETGLELLSSQ